MTTRPGQHLTRRSAARALDRSGTSGVPHVDHLLAAATAPASSTALSHEHDLVAAFRAARPGAAPATADRSLARRTSSRMAVGKVAVAAFSAVLLAGGGVAFAATTGNLPEVLGGDHRSENGEKHSSPAPGPQATRSPRPGNGSTAPKRAPDPAYRGLCVAYQKGAGSNPGAAAGSPAFAALATAAGGKAEIAGYCAALVATPGPGPTTGPTSGATKPPHPVHPTRPAHPAKPTKAAKTPNPNKPTAKPTPTPNPNKPTAAPSRTPNPNKPTRNSEELTARSERR